MVKNELIAFVMATSQTMKAWRTASLVIGFGGFFYGVVVRLEDIWKTRFSPAFCFYGKQSIIEDSGNHFHVLSSSKIVCNLCKGKT